MIIDWEYILNMVLMMVIGISVIAMKGNSYDKNKMRII